eukprot:4548660-Lingulodinium_polyedra.AAC.1
MESAGIHVTPSFQERAKMLDSPGVSVRLTATIESCVIPTGVKRPQNEGTVLSALPDPQE